MRFLLMALLAVSACDTNPASFSQPVGINLKAKSGDVSNNAINEQKGINTESGNPYGAFIQAATSALGGKPPGRIEVEKATLLVGGGSTGVTTLDQIFTGEVDVLFTMNTSNNSYNVANLTNPTGGGPDSMTVVWKGSTVAAQDLPELLTGSFKVVLRGPAAASFPQAGAEANLQVTLTFEAFQK
jgi:hypothetical protein